MQKNLSANEKIEVFAEKINISDKLGQKMIIV